MKEETTPTGADVKCVAVIQCAVAHERCAGSHCGIAFGNRRHLMAAYGPEVKYYLPFSCGGCPGRRVGRLLSTLEKTLKRVGVGKHETVVHLSSCLAFDSGHYPPCPHLADIRTMAQRKGYRVVEGTHLSETAERKRAEGVYRKRGSQDR